ncbi:MAG: pentapeptide repeat-containing protein [Cyanobacteriota bacterium]
MEAATELEAAGRDQDVRALKERLLKPEHRLVVLYGQSGVGKSSLLQAGLAPALKSQALGQARLCPVYVRRYDGKLGELTTGLELPAGADWEAIIARAREWDRQERRLVLIFDQFEEFFFAFPQGEQQRRFFDGLAALLKEVLSAKVVLSLRKDYLHLLVDYPQIAPNAAGVLAADNLYELRDFTPEAATQLIERLTAKSNFAMSPLLIQTVVADLTREGKVRPIELQILGAQLQEQKRDIRGLSQYDAAGGKPQLLRDYVSQATRACGSANETLAGATLFLLTDEQERRLLKTRSELAEGLAQLGQRFEPSQLDLALDILGRSGLVVEIPEEPEARYQILHDYLVGLIRAQQEPLLAQLAAELEQEKAQRFEAEGRLAQVRSEIEAAQREREKLALKKSALEAEKGSLGDEIRDARRRLKNLFRMTLGMLGVATISGIFLPIAFTSHLNKRNYYESVLAAYEQELKKYTTSRKNTNGNSTLATEMAKVTREFIQAKTTYTLTVLSEDSSFLNLATIPILNKIDIFKDDNIRRRDSLLSYLRQMGLGFTSRLGYPPRNTDFFKDIEITNHSTGNLITLQNIDLGLSHFRDATFFRVNFDGGYFGYADLRGAYFSSSSLQNVIFSGADLTKATFIDVSLKKADFTRANLTGATGIALKTLQKQQAIICNTTMPDGQIVSLNCKPK